MKAEIGKRYRHYKNMKEYIVLAIAYHSETMERLVVYEAQYDVPELGSKPVFARPKDMFEGRVEHEGKNVEHFELIG